MFVFMAVMLVGVAMIMFVIMGMVVTATAIVAVFVIVIMMTMTVMVMLVGPRRLFGVGAAFRLKRCIHARDLCTQFRDHFFQHMVTADQDAVSQNLRGHVPVSDMPGDAREKMRLGPDFDYRLARGNHAHHTAIFERNAIAVAQHRRVSEVQQEYGVLRTAHGNTAAVTAVMRKLDVIGFF